MIPKLIRSGLWWAMSRSGAAQAANRAYLLGLAARVGDDWVQGDYYDEAERVIVEQWNQLIWPLIHDVDFSVTLELAAGHGRNTALLLRHASQLVAVDINHSNINFLKKRFRNENKLKVIQNNGVDLEKIANESVTFIYSFDAMVHFDSDVVRNYIKEFRRILTPGGQGFCHYSNNIKNPTGSYRDHPGWRNFMCRPLFEHWLAKEGLRVLRSHYVRANQEIIDHDDGTCDAATLFERPR